MMIAHASLPADEPERVARVLAEIMGGTALPFPPGGPRTWMAWSADEAIELEIAPRGLDMDRGPDGANWRTPHDGRRRTSEAHLAVAVDRPHQEIMDIAAAAGWPVERWDRAGFFHVVEVWVEGAFLIEFLDPAATADYRRNMTLANWKQIFEPTGA